MSEDPARAALEQRIAELEAKLGELDARGLDLENEVVRRGVKLSCANIALARAKIAFDETTRQREHMVQEIAHDLRTPLTSVKGAAQNLLDGVAGELGESAREYVEIIHEHAGRLVGVVNWLVEAIRAGSEPIDLEPTDLDLGELVCEVIRGMRPLAAERGITLEAEAPRLMLLADGPKLTQVVQNLVGNALKFTGEGGHVSVALAEDGAELVLTVTDDGVGMSAEEQGRIFDRYYRSTSEGGGTGLGLVIVKEIVNQHDGTISVTSAPSEGSTFEVRLPKESRHVAAWAALG